MTEPLPASTAALPTGPAARLASIDAYRGFVMLLMMAEVLHLRRVERDLPDSYVVAILAHMQSHVAWVGCSLHDLIQPSFSFLVGAVLPFSLAGRAARGASKASVLSHALWRGLLLVLLGVFLRSVGRPQTNWTFVDTLTQIGFGFPILVWLGFCRVRTQVIATVAIIFGYWLAWALYPLPAGATEFAAHWTKGAGIGHVVDVWFVNLFPRARPFTGNPEGYLTLNFVPTLATMLLGLIAGNWLRNTDPVDRRLWRMLLVGLAAIAAGLLLHVTGLCPLVKKLWTPSWTLFSGGICFIFLAGFHAAIDWRGHRAWAFPLIVIGANSITAYCLAHLIDGFIIQTFQTHFGKDVFVRLAGVWSPVLEGAAVLLVLWLVLFWMFRRKLFVKI